MGTPSQYYSDYFKNTILSSFLNTFKNARTANEYNGYIRLICNYLEKDFLEISTEDADSYFRHLYGCYQRGELKRHTINVRLSSYNSLSKFICDTFQELQFINPFSNQMLGEIDSTVSVSSVPSLLEIDAILSAAKEDDMYFLIFSLACRAALPVSRILQINTNNMHMDGENIILIFDTDKDFGEPHYVRLPLDVTKLLNSYISNRIFPDNTGHVFYNKRNRPLTLQNLEVGARKYFAAAGLDGLYSLKDLKTRAIIDMKRAGVSSEIIAQYTGLSTSRITAYKRASAMYTECPADLANIQIKSERAADA